MLLGAWFILTVLAPVRSFSTATGRRADAALPDLYEATIAELQDGLDAERFTSVDLVNAYFARIKEVNEELHAVIETSPTALAQAAELDVQRKDGKKLGPLHGIPILVKDNIATRVEDGMNTTAGSYALLGSAVSGDSSVVAKLRAAGAIIIGKTNLVRVGAGVPGRYQLNFSRNGQRLARWRQMAGRAEAGRPQARIIHGGSGVAASIGLAAVTLGTETAGSITCPASKNNVVGVKATVGLTSRTGVVPISQHQDTVGPLTRTVTDAAIVLNVIAGKDAADNYTNAQPDAVPDYVFFLEKDALKVARLGIPREPYSGRTSTRNSLGAVITDPANIPTAANESSSGDVLHVDLKFDMQAYLATLNEIPTNVHTVDDIAAFNDAHKDLEEPQLDAYTSWNLHFNLAKDRQKDDAYTAAVALSYDLGRTKGIDAALKEHNLDALVLPDSSLMYTMAGMAGYPIVTVPLGFLPNDTKILDVSGKDEVIETAPGIPFGLLFVGTAFSETKLLAYAYAFEQATNVRLGRRAYEKATPKTQLADVFGLGAGGASGSAGAPSAEQTAATGAAFRLWGYGATWMVGASVVGLRVFFGF
ncbi:Amidase domain-containing protein [Mycena kentingensis (nom. inval.)]|nr:Amidase domain-containing protein [Mycena kentingensis (nom. inval.)]